MGSLYNRARMSTATTGTGTVTLGQASTGYASFAEAGVQNADVVSYVIEDGNNFETGQGTYTSVGLTLSRDTVYLSKIAGEAASTDKLSLSGSATVFITGLAEDFARRPLFGVNADADTTNRLSVTSPAVLFNRGTDDIQVKLNKEAEGDTASFLFQTAFSGRAEFGLIGDDDFTIKVSPDNFSTSFTSIVINKDNGEVTINSRDITADGTKLDGIESGATADQSAADIRSLGFFDTSNDGTGSGLDADLLDGVHSSAFLQLTGGTMSGTLAMADQPLTRPRLQDYSEVVNALGDLGGGTDDIDLEDGNVVSATVSTSTQTFTFSNPPATGRCGSFTLILTNGGSQTVNWPASVDWAGGTAPTLTASGVDILTFFTVNAGSTWFGFAAGLDMS